MSLFGEGVLQALRVGRLLEELLDATGFRVGVDDAELGGEGEGLADAGHGGLRAGLDVRVEHLPEVHPVDVVGADHDHDVGLLVVDEVQALQDRVGGAGEPALAEPLLRRHRGDVGVEQGGHPPGLGDVTVEAVGLVLGEDDDLSQPGVYEVGDREIDQSVLSAEGHRRFCAIGREGHESLALAAGEDDAEDLLWSGHDPTLECESHRVLAFRTCESK